MNNKAQKYAEKQTKNIQSLLMETLEDQLSAVGNNLIEI